MSNIPFKTLNFVPNKDNIFFLSWCPTKIQSFFNNGFGYSTYLKFINLSGTKLKYLIKFLVNKLIGF